MKPAFGGKEAVKFREPFDVQCRCVAPIGQTVFNRADQGGVLGRVNRKAARFCVRGQCTR